MCDLQGFDHHEFGKPRQQGHDSQQHDLLAGLVAPVQYTILIWGTLYGYIIFADIPDLFTFVGAAIIIASGLYTVHRERLRSQNK